MAPWKSTIDRFIAVEAPRAALSSLDAVAPAASAVIGARLWFRLPASPSAERRARRQPAGGVGIELPWHGGTIKGRVYGPDGDPAAYLVHGWGGWWQQLAAMVEPLREAGFRVVAFDAPSHGSSSPGRHGRRHTTVMEMADAYAAVLERFGPARLVVAHSLGVMGVLRARSEGTAADAYAFVAPASSVRDFLPVFGAMAGLRPRTHPRLAEQLERRIGLPLEDFDTAGLARRAQTHPPMLAVHDRGDRETPATGSIALAEAWPGSELVLTDGLGHRRILWDPTAVAAVVDFARNEVAVS
jgi:pimeloyl-ACP methyl ester carboxylesterase